MFSPRTFIYTADGADIHAKMKIFLSYASEDRATAESISLALAEQGHDVFFDRKALPAGDEFHARIRRAIESSDLFIFLASAHAIDAGSYTLNELDIAAKTWRSPAGRVMPVLIDATDVKALPSYLTSVTVLQTRGNIVAMVVDAVYRLARARRRAFLTKTALAVTAVAVLASAAAVYWRTRADADEITGRDGAPAVRVPAGVFTMGDDEHSPQRDVYTDAFYIDKFEVTVGRYARFLKATGSVSPPEDWNEVDVQQAAELPVIGVSWNDAQAYCHWAGKRLPTEAEWEKAARGTDGRRYPWGNETPDIVRTNSGNTSPKAYDGGLSPVGSHPSGSSPFGVHDMAGNAAEWVSDWYAESFRREDTRNPQGAASGNKKVIRGGGRFDAGDRLAVTRRYFANPDEPLQDVGFRCAR
jgi:formylglycine-generating enzyme required for sulfatase activity